MAQPFQPNPDFDNLFSADSPTIVEPVPTVIPTVIDTVVSTVPTVQSVYGKQLSELLKRSPHIKDELTALMEKKYGYSLDLSEYMDEPTPAPTPATLRVAYSPFSSVRDNRANGTVDMLWTEVVAKLSKHQIFENKEDASLFNGIIFKNNEGGSFTRRCAVNGDKITMLLLDYDATDTFDSIRAKFSPYEFLQYTSHSHKTKNKHFRNCFRVVFPLQFAMNFDDYMKKIPAIQSWAGSMDKSSTDRTRAFYLPSCAQAMVKHSRVWHNKGKLLDLSQFTDFVPKPVDYSKYAHSEFSDKDREGILRRLTLLGNPPREAWLRVIWGLRTGGFSKDEIWGWSQNCRHSTGGLRGNGLFDKAYDDTKSATSIGVVLNFIKRKSFDTPKFKK